ncbi:DUF535 family protein [Helicobacter cetorum]|nr:DUF535 family protein [Helicobacter cetorum]
MISHKHNPHFLDNIISKSHLTNNPQQLESFYDNLFKVVTNNPQQLESFYDNLFKVVTNNPQQLESFYDNLFKVVTNNPQQLESFYDNLFKVVTNNPQQLESFYDNLFKVVTNNPQQLESFYDNLFRHIDNRIKQSKKEALVVVANIIQMIVYRMYKFACDFETTYKKAHLMGANLRAIEWLLSRPNILITIRDTFSNFCDTRYNKEQHLDLFIQNLIFLHNLQVKDPTTSQAVSLLKAKALTFHRAEIDGGGAYYFNLTSEHVYLNEGFLGITLEYEKEKKQLLYTMKFHILDNKYLVISCMQGIQNLEESYKLFTKNYHRIRPNFFLVKLARELGKLLGCSKLLGLPTEAQISFRFHANDEINVFKFNYDNFFTECEAQLIEIEGRTYWDIPLNEKPIEEYPQKYRSRQRARRKVLETFKEDLEKILVLDE